MAQGNRPTAPLASTEPMLAQARKLMPVISFMRLALAVPVLVPVLAILLSFLIRAVSGSNEATDLTRWTYFLVFSLVIGGLPYLVFVVAVVLWSRGKNARAIYRLSFVAPFLFAAILVALGFTFMLISNQSPYALDAALSSTSYYAGLGVGLGYVYVALVHVAYAVLWRIRMVEQLGQA